MSGPDQVDATHGCPLGVAMIAIRDYVRRHHVALLALLLVFTSSSAYAATKVHLPKNSVASRQVKDKSLLGRDVKDGALTGADLGEGSVTGGDLGDGSVTGADLGDGSVTGGDLKDGTVTAQDLAATAVPVTRVVQVTDVPGGSPAKVFDDPLIGTITFSCGPGPIDMQIVGSIPPAAQPGAVRTSGVDITDNSPVGASTISTSTVQAAPIAGGFGGAALIPQGTLFLDTAAKRVGFDWDASGCIIRGLLVVTDKVAQPDLTPARGTSAEPECTAVGDAYCVVD